MSMIETAATPGPAAGSRLGDRVRALRVSAGLTQTELAGDRFSKEYISQIERGKTRPTAETIVWLSERLGWRIAGLVDCACAVEPVAERAVLGRHHADCY